jgi:thiamine kinase-like enzyme
LDCEGAVQPVDWESAALAAGEIDLAMLTDDWPPALSNVCDAAYAEARWPRRVPDEFWSILEYARMYVQFRWLGDDPKWTLRRGSARRFKRLAALGSMLELLPSSTTR